MFVATPIFVLGGVAFYALLLLATALFILPTSPLLKILPENISGLPGMYTRGMKN